LKNKSKINQKSSIFSKINQTLVQNKSKKKKRVTNNPPNFPQNKSNRSKINQKD